MTASPASPATPGAPPRVVFTHRGDPLVPYLGTALRAGFDVVGEVEVDISALSRLLVAAVTVRADRASWGERYIKSGLGMLARSRRVRQRLVHSVPPYDVVFQTHALYRVDGPRTVLYVDCTHRQSVESWPAWNPLRGRALERWLERERAQYHAAAHVFAFSRATRRSLVDDYGVSADRVSVVGAGLDFATVVPRQEPDPAAPVLLFVGHDFRRKGGHELLGAFARVREAFPAARLLLVGSGCPEVDQPGVEVLGAVSDRGRLAQLYAAASVFCLPAHFEPFGLVLLEAMAHGLPCVATDSCGIPDVVVDGVTGSVVGDGDDLATDLAAALIGLLGSPETLRRLGDAGRRRVQEKFLWTHVVERMRPVIDEIARRGRVARPDPHHDQLTALTTGDPR